jgi:hypothetical protein
MHPYGLGRTLRNNGDERSIKLNHGSLYIVVGQLAKAGFITEQDTTHEGQPTPRTHRLRALPTPATMNCATGSASWSRSRNASIHNSGRAFADRRAKAQRDLPAAAWSARPR